VFRRSELSGLLDWLTAAHDAVSEGDPARAERHLLAARGWLLAKAARR
jgi:hypothetical protein